MGKNIKRILLMIFTVVILLLTPTNADMAYATELGVPVELAVMERVSAACKVT